MKKLKLLGSLAAMLLLPSVVHADDSYSCTGLVPSDFSSFKDQNGDDIEGYPSTSGQQISSFSYVDANTNVTLIFTCEQNGGLAFPKTYKKGGTSSKPTPERFFFLDKNKVTVTSDNKNVLITRITTYNTYASNNKATEWTASEGTQTALPNNGAMIDWSGSTPTVTFTCAATNTSSTTGQSFTSLDIEYTIAESTPEPPYSVDFKTKNAPSDWTYYMDSNSSKNPWAWEGNGMDAVYAQDEEYNQIPHDYWAVAPKLKLEPGTYNIRMDIHAEEAVGGVEEVICLTKSAELPNAETTPFITYTITDYDEDVVVTKEDDNQRSSELTRTLKADLVIDENQGGEFYIGIYDKTAQNGSYAWATLKIENFSIKKVEEQHTAWDSFKAQGTKVTATGNYDVQIKNAEGITLNYGGQNLDVTVNTSNDKAEFTGFEEFNGDYNTVTLTIPEGAFETDLENEYPAAEQTIDIAYDMQGTTYKMNVYPTENRVQITMFKNYGKTEKTAQFKLNLKDYSTGNVVAALEVGDLTTEVGAYNDYVSFALPALEAGDYTLELQPMSLRSCNTYTSTGHTPWMMNKNALASGKFTITGVVEFIDEDATGIYQAIDDTYVTLVTGSATNKIAEIPASVVDPGTGKTYYVQEIGEGAFKNGGDLDVVEIPSTVKVIGKNAFKGIGINSILIPSSVKTIGEGAFNEGIVEELVLDMSAAEWALVTKGENAFGDVDNAWPAFETAKVFIPEGNTAAGYADLMVNTTDPTSIYGMGAFYPSHFVRGNEYEFAINDGVNYYHMGNPSTNVNVTYSRSYNGKWSALFLPFDLQVSTITAKGGKVAKLSRMSEGEIVWDFVNEGKLSANTPYLVKMPANELGVLTVLAENSVNLKHHKDHGEFSIVDGEFKMLEEGETPGEFSLRGTYVTITDMKTQGYYAIASSDGNFHPAQSDDVTLKPYRIYLVRNNSMSKAPVRSIIRGEDTVTSVEDLDIEVVDRSEYINLNGNRVANPDKGIYIVNGKKVVIK